MSKHSLALSPLLGSKNNILSFKIKESVSRSGHHNRIVKPFFSETRHELNTQRARKLTSTRRHLETEFISVSTVKKFCGRHHVMSWLIPTMWPFLKLYQI